MNEGKWICFGVILKIRIYKWRISRQWRQSDTSLQPRTPSSVINELELYIKKGVIVSLHFLVMSHFVRSFFSCLTSSFVRGILRGGVSPFADRNQCLVRSSQSIKV